MSSIKKILYVLCPSSGHQESCVVLGLVSCLKTRFMQVFNVSVLASVEDCSQAAFIMFSANMFMYNMYEKDINRFSLCVFLR